MPCDMYIYSMCNYLGWFSLLDLASLLHKESLLSVSKPSLAAGFPGDTRPTDDSWLTHSYQKMLYNPILITFCLAYMFMYTIAECISARLWIRDLFTHYTICRYMYMHSSSIMFSERLSLDIYKPLFTSCPSACYKLHSDCLRAVLYQTVYCVVLYWTV